MIKLLIFPVTLICSIVITIWLTVPTYKEAQKIKNENIPQAQGELDKELKISNNIKNLKEEYSLNEYDLRTLNYALPEDEDVQSLLVQVEALTLDNGIIYKDVAIKEDIFGQAVNQQFAMGGSVPFIDKSLPRPVPIILDLSLKGPWENLQKFFKEIETLNRLTNITKTKISLGEAGDLNLNCEISLEVYRKDPIEAIDVQNAFMAYQQGSIPEAAVTE